MERIPRDRRCKLRLGCCLWRGERSSKWRSSVRRLALRLYEDKGSTFARLVDGFITCTKESREEDPHVVMRSIRQFVDGMKNYLWEHATRKLSARGKWECGAGEAAEEALQELVVAPLRDHVTRLLETRLAGCGSTGRLASNMAVARGRTAQELGAGDHVPAPPEASLDALCRMLARLRRERLPTDKLRHLVACVRALLIEVTSCSERRSLGGAMSGDDLLPMLVLLVAHSGMTSAELEAEYMWGLLDRASLFSEGGYYLTTFFCAVQAIKNLPAHQPLS